MNLTGNNRINQRIERMTTEDLIVGIDIAKEVHVAAATNFRGVQQGSVCVFTNDEAGFQKLMHWVKRLERTTGLCHETIFGMEPTGHYGMTLASWLDQQGYSIMLVNPMTTKRNKENRDNRQSKHDAKDAVVIADLICRGYYSPMLWHEVAYRKLRCAVTEREALAIDATRLGNQIQKVIDQLFPEFFHVFKEWNGVRALATLQAFPAPRDILENDIDTMIEKWRYAGMKRCGGKEGRAYAAGLRAAAKRSIGLCDTEQELKRNLSRLVTRYVGIKELIREVEQEIDQQLAELPDAARRPMKELGLSSLYTAVLLANTGGLDRYAHGQQVIALAGLSLRTNSSGKKKGQVSLEKRGRRQLRKYLYLATLNLVSNHPAFKAWHHHHVHVKNMKKQRSIFKLIGKLTRILVAIAHSGERFNKERTSARERQVA